MLEQTFREIYTKFKLNFLKYFPRGSIQQSAGAGSFSEGDHGEANDREFADLSYSHRTPYQINYVRRLYQQGQFRVG
ncbi:MAG: hypothetical protein ACLS8R_09400 [Anaeromassilibacillus sp.]